ncbi:MAG: carbohydrate binding family 9 domain-containing protein, partial [Rhodothermales bacterium]|nr:carbohydrate binding family 9 domain-containing protein [Rhodothermales bacterium]
MRFFNSSACIVLFAVLFSALSPENVRAQVDENGDVPAVQDQNTSSPRQQVLAIRKSQDVTVDGILDEDAWRLAPAIDRFIQDEPNEGKDPSEKTVVRVLYDDEAIYIGARMYDSAPDSIVARLGRRDSNLDADLFGFFIDPYLDRRTGFYFGINAAGTLLDGVLLNDDWDDDSWDGVWQGKAKVDSEGWTAEMRIPYSQLRFRESDVYTWGINFRRDISRRNERIFLIHTPRDESGFVSRFADMNGIEQISPPRQIEVTPYITTKAAFVDNASGDPFNDGSEFTPDVGADFKIGVTPNLTLNATVNPDFGQV